MFKNRGGGSVRPAPALISEADLEGTLNPAPRDDVVHQGPNLQKNLRTNLGKT